MSDLDTSHVSPSGIVGLLGLPFDENSSFMRGPALAPARIREALSSGSANLCAENERDLDAEHRFQDLGDLALTVGTAAFHQIEETVAKLLLKNGRVLALGGDHSITYPIARAYSGAFERLSILHLDAHPDLYDEFEGNRLSHACPFARIMEEKLVECLVQIGIRTMNPHQRSQADRFGVQVHLAKDDGLVDACDLDGPVYVSLDLDVLDPAFAPGVSHHEPGGLSTRDVLRVIQLLPGPIVGADIVEYNPKRDPLGITAMAAAKFLKELAVRMLE